MQPVVLLFVVYPLEITKLGFGATSLSPLIKEF